MLGVLFVLGLAAAFEVSNTLGSNMVLQRDVPNVIWGFATAGVTVNVNFRGQDLKATTDGNGEWRVTTPATPAGGPIDIAITSSEGNVSLINVVFGDVFLCGGQSNMQMTPTAGLDNMTAEINTADSYPNIRLFTVGQGTSSPNAPLRQLKTILQTWTPSNKKSVGGDAWATFSSVCFLFGREVYDRLGGKVPIGLVSNNWGGTAVQQWSSADALKKCNVQGPSELYNAMISPYTVAPMNFVGATWYQGEANVGAADMYACLHPAMVEDWRAKLGNPKLWFGFVHLAGYDYGAGPAPGDLRAAQLVTLNLPYVGHSTAVDVGMAKDIHPQNKQTVALRLANSILNQRYGLDLPWRSPIYKSSSATTQGTTVTVTIAFQDGTIGTGLTNKIPAYAQKQGADQCQSIGLNPTSCGFPTIELNDPGHTTIAATVSVSPNGQNLIFRGEAPQGGLQAAATSYGRASWAVTSFFNSIGNPVLGWYAPITKGNATDNQIPRLFPSSPRPQRVKYQTGPSQEWFVRL